MKSIRILRNVYANSPVGSYGHNLSMALQEFCYPDKGLTQDHRELILGAMSEFKALGHVSKFCYDSVKNKLDKIAK